MKIKNSDIAKELCLPPVKLHCSSKFDFPIRAACLVDDTFNGRIHTIAALKSHYTKCDTTDCLF